MFRPIDPVNDREDILRFNASFTTDRIYRVHVREMNTEIVEETIEPPLYKRYPMEGVFDELTSSAFDGRSILACVGGEIAGFVVLNYERWNRRVRLSHLYVADLYRRFGIGREMVEQAVAFARERDARCLWLETQNINYSAIQFYKKRGFRFCGFDDTLYAASNFPGEVALFFELRT